MNYTAIKAYLKNLFLRQPQETTAISLPDINDIEGTQPVSPTSLDVEELSLDDVEGAQPVSPTSLDVEELSPLDRAAVDLVRLILWMMFSLVIVVVIVVIIVFIYKEYKLNKLIEFQLESKITPIEIPFVKDAIGEAIEKFVEYQKKLFESWINLLKLILFNIFFPLLTAILGYLFGTRNN